MTKTKFKVGDRVKIDLPGDKSNGKIGTIVKKFDTDLLTVKIPGFDGHVGGIFDGTTYKWYVLEKNLIKLPEEKESMKIEVKSTPKTSKTISYPCFRRSTNECKFVVLFFNKNFGVVVDRGSSGWRNGETMDFESVQFETLQNYSVTISSQP